MAYFEENLRDEFMNVIARMKVPKIEVRKLVASLLSLVNSCQAFS